MSAVTQREDAQAGVAPRAGSPAPVAKSALLVSALGNRVTARLAARSDQRLAGGRAISPASALLAGVSAAGNAAPAQSAGRERSHHDDLAAEAAGGALLREAVAARAGQQLVQRIGLKDVPLIGKTLWCQMEMGRAYALKAECMKEFKEACPGDMLDPKCTNFCRRPLLKRDERAWWERWFGLAPDPNRIVPMGEPGSSGDISGCILDCMKSKDPDAMGTFLEVCSGNAASAMGD